MGKLGAVRQLAGQWRSTKRKEVGRTGLLTGLLLIILALLVDWPKEPPRIEPFIYAHF
jgi:hypothetical protein